MRQKQIVMINILDATKNKISNGERLALFNDLGEIEVFVDAARTSDFGAAVKAKFD